MRSQPMFYLLTFMLSLFSIVSFAQSKVASGKILDAANQPLQGVSIKVKNTSNGTLSGADGAFSISVNEGAQLVISYVGYMEQTVSTKGVSDITIHLAGSITELTQVVVIGNRGAPRTATESAVPVDVINVNSLAQTTGRPDLMSQLNISVPSFNYNKQSGTDGSDAIDFASLRGLGFDQTLVLVNGKRRHQSAFVNQTGTRGRGNSGTDLNAIPENAIDRIEVLRDGASAQYGSDAIAGVINIILKKDVNKLNVTAGVSSFYDHKYNSLNAADPTQFYTGHQLDGKTVNAGLSYGLPLGRNGGFVNLSATFMKHGKTFRAEPDTNVSTNDKALPANVWRRAFGDGAVTTVGGMFNAEVPVKGTNTKFYFFGGYNHKLSNVYAWTRNSDNPSRFPTDTNGVIVYVPDIMHTASDGTVFYNPQENVFIQDGSFATGFRGTFRNGIDWDISNVVGMNDFHYYGYKTFNVSLLPVNELQAAKTNFDDGGFNFLQNTLNLDLSRHYDKVASGLTVAVGGEFRYEHYTLYKGDPDSYIYGGAYYRDTTDGTIVVKRSGSQGYPGYLPSDEANAHRTNVGGYLDFTLDATKAWLIDVAARFENYSDFGFVNTYKFATRYKVAQNFNLRGSISTGFRAPSLQQINFSNTNTTIVNVPGQGPVLQYTKLSPNGSPITKAAGIPKLKQETSVNASLGFTWKPVRSLVFTVDGYWVQMKNRVVGTGNFDEGIPALAPFLAQYNVTAVNFFANAVNTTNTGIDVVADYTQRLGTGTLKATLAGNIQHIAIDKINIPATLSSTYANRQAFFSTREQAFLKASAPNAKGTFSLDYNIKKFGVGARVNYFGKLVTQGFGSAYIDSTGSGGPGTDGVSNSGNGWDPYVQTTDGKSVVPENFVFNAKATVDVYANYKVTKDVSFLIGVDNLFNVHPDQAVTKNAINSWGDSEGGGPFDAVQMGFNGLRFFSKFVFNF